MAGLNKVMVIGNVGREPEMRYTQTGVPVTSFSVASSRRWTTPEGEQREETEWFNVVTWNKLAETASRYVSKGSKVYIEGRLQTRSWEGQDGQKRYRTEIVAQTMILLDSRPKTPGAAEDVYTPDDMEPDEIPF
ncbi:MAG: single-stranded DNA-binding protein [Chloroflexi bacterium]|nr:single-stranded DNA-binding protein [Chloroflexota bacterium]